MAEGPVATLKDIAEQGLKGPVELNPIGGFSHYKPPESPIAEGFSYTGRSYGKL